MIRGLYGYDGPPRVVIGDHIVYEEDIGRPTYDLDPVPPERSLEVSISGGSMGGLFTGFGLQRAGHAVDIYEKTAPGEMRSRGAGIVMQPELLEFMERNALADREEVVLTVEGLQYLDHDGSVLEELDHPFYLTSWDTTYRSLRNSLPDDRYHMDRRVVGVEQRCDSVEVRFADGEPRTSDYHVVAEGYRSPTREQLLPEVDVEYAGYVAWRGIKPAREFPPDIRDRFDEKFVYYHGPDFQINGYPVPGPTGETGDDLRINLVWYSKASPREFDRILLDNTGRRREGSVPPGYVREEVLAEQIETARDSLPEVFARFFTAFDEPYVQGVYDIATTRMALDRVAIIGDAAFFIRPHMAAGTAFAAASGLSLAGAFAGADPDPELEAWEATQLQLGRHLVRRAKARGNRYMQLGQP